MASGDATALFYFDTNIGAVANNIAAGLSRINASLKEPMRLNDAGVQANAGALGQLVTNTNAEIERGLTRLRQQFQQGGFSAPQAKAALESNLKETFGGLRGFLANEVGRLPGSVAATAPMGELGSQAARAYVQGARELIRREFPSAFPGVKGQAFASLVNQVRADPIDYSSPRQDPLSFYRNQARAEGFLRRDPEFRQESQARAQAQGFSPAYMAALRDRTVREVDTEQGTDYKFTPTDAVARVRDLARANQTAETTAQRLKRSQDAAYDRLERDAYALNKAYDDQVRATNELATARRNAGDGLVKEGPLYRNRVTGERIKRTPAGAISDRDQDLHTLDVQAANDAAARAAERVARAEAKVAQSADELATAQQAARLGLQRQFGAYQTPSGGYLREGGDGARPVTNPLAVARLDRLHAQAEEERANFRRLQDNPDLTQRVAGREVFDRSEVYRIKGTDQAERITNEREVARILARQDEILDSQFAKEQRLAQQALVRSTREQATQGGFGTGFANRFQRGQGSLLNTLGTQVASAASFSAGYATLFGGLGAIQSINTEFMDFQDSMTDFEVAVGSADRVTNDWLGDLGELSRMTGENLGAALDSAARGVRAFSAPDAPVAEQRSVSDATARAATQLGLVANKPLTDATGDVIAAGSAFDLRADQLDQITQAVANAKRTLGGDATQISQGLASIGTAAKTAGFDLDEAASVISLVQARTDQSGVLIASRLTRIFQTVSGSTGKRLGRELEVDTTASTRDQLARYAEIYDDPATSKSTQDRISSALGGTANLREILPLLQEGARLQDAYTEAATNAGQGQEEFERKSANIIGTFKKIQGDLSNIAVYLTRTDIFAPFGLAVKTVEPLLDLLQRMLNIVDDLPDPIRQAGVYMIDLALAAKAFAVVNGIRAERGIANAVLANEVQTLPSLGGRQTAAVRSAAAEAASAARSTAVRDAEAVGIAKALAARLAAEDAMNAGVVAAGRAEHAAAVARARFDSREVAQAFHTENIRYDRRALNVVHEGEGSASRLATAGGAVGAVGAGATGAAGAGARVAAGGISTGLRAGFAQLGAALVNPWTIAVGALVGGAILINKVMRGFEERTQFLTKYTDTTLSVGSSDGSSSSLSQAAKDLQTTSGIIKKSSTSTETSRESRDELSSVLKDQAAALRVVARGVGQEEASLAKKANISVFGDGGVITSVSDLASGLNALSEAGITARGRMKALQQALENTATPEDGRKFLPKRTAADLIGEANAGILNGLPTDDVQVLVKKTITDTKAAQRAAYEGLQNLYEPSGIIGPGRQDVPLVTTSTVLESVSDQQAAAEVAKANPYDVINKKILDGIKRLGIKRGDILTDAQKVEIARLGADAYNLDAIPEDADDVRAGIYSALLGSFDLGPVLPGRPSQRDPLAHLALPPTTRKGLLNGKGALSREDIKNLLEPGEAGPGEDQPYQGLPANLQDAVSAVPKSDDGTQLRAVLRRNRDTVKELVRRAALDGENIPELNDLLDSTQHEYASARIDHLERLRTHDQGGRGLSKRAIKRIGRDYLAQEIAAAGKDTNLLIQVMDHADDASLNVVQASIERAARVARHARVALAQAVVGAAGGIFGTFDPASVGLSEPEKIERAFKRSRRQADRGNDFVEGDSKDTKEEDNSLTAEQRAARLQRTRLNVDQTLALANNQLRQAKADFAAYDGNQKDAEYFSLLQGVADAKEGVAQAQQSHADVISHTQAQRVGGGLASARDQINTAARALRNSARGTDSWWQALGSFYDGQRAVREAVLAYQSSRDQLRGDITDPVEQARDTLRASLRKLRSDRRAGQGRDVIAEDRVSARRDRAALQDSKFQQRLSDIQTGNDLGRISFAKYMAYLDHEHDRLSRIHHRTRQQQDQLDTVDKAMKDALNSMDSQFNLGDINTNGLVYQVRRFKAEMASGGATPRMAASNVRRFKAEMASGGATPRMAASNATTNQTVSISINGADTAKVKTIIDGYLRVGGGQRRTVARRKV